MSNGEWYYLLSLLAVLFGTVFYNNITNITEQGFSPKYLVNAIASAIGVLGIIAKLTIMRIS